MSMDKQVNLQTIINMVRHCYKAIICWVILIWLLTACDSQTRYHQFRHIDKKGWQMKDTVTLEVPLSDSLQSHLLKLQIRHTTRYPYKNIIIGLQAFSPDMQFTKTAQFSAILMDDKGNWISSGQGGLYLLDMGEMLLAPSIPGNWHINVFHAMGDTLLPGIHDIGIEVSALSASVNTQENKE